MKRCLVLVMMIAVLVPLFCISAGAAFIRMDEMLPADQLPAGYVYPRWVIDADVFSWDKHELVFYDQYNDVFLRIQFQGTVRFVENGGAYLLNFSNEASLVVRAYPCFGRDVFSYTPEQVMMISFPASKFAEIVPNASADIYGSISSYGSNSTISLYGSDSTGYSGYISGSSSTELVDLDVFFPSASINFSAIDMQLRTSASASRGYDYYVVPRGGSGIVTPLDFKLSFGFTDYGGDLGRLMMLASPVFGFPVALTTALDDMGSFRYAYGSYYYVNARVGDVRLYDAEKMPDNAPRLSLPVMNRFLTHFGYDPLVYSAAEQELSDSVSEVGDALGGMMGDASDGVANAGDTVQAVATDLSKFGGFFNQVFAILPVWVIALISIYLVFMLIRKVLGR